MWYVCVCMVYVYSMCACTVCVYMFDCEDKSRLWHGYGSQRATSDISSTLPEALVLKRVSLVSAAVLCTPGWLVQELPGCSSVSTSHLTVGVLELQKCTTHQIYLCLRTRTQVIRFVLEVILPAQTPHQPELFNY